MSALKTIDHDATTAVAPLTPMDMLQQALSSGASMEMMEKLLGLQERWEATQARKAFDAAMASLRNEMPEIVKNRFVSYGEGNKKTEYRHEDLDAVTRALSPVMAKHGLSFRWRTKSEPNQPVSVTCIISHRDGHYEETSLSAGADSSGGKNSIQAIGSTLTYLQRYSLKAAIGAAASLDDDGGTATETANDFITEDQEMELQALIEDVNADKPKFLKFLKVERLADIKASKFATAIQALEAKRNRP